MSESYGSVSATRPEESTETQSTTDQVKSEAANVKDTAKAEAGNVAETAKYEAGSVVDTAKGEAKSVANEAKSQARTLYAQTKNELSDQAGAQQQKAAAGLRSISDELRSLASGETPQNRGIASDLVREASTRISGVASWLGDRDPAELLDDVKAYARRKPGLFIGAAALAGIVAGRLARALTEHNADEKADRERYAGSPSAAAGPTVPRSYVGVSDATYPVTGTDDLAETPLYAERSASLSGGYAQEGDGNVRPDSL